MIKRTVGQNCLMQDGGPFCQKVLLPFIVITSLCLLFTWQNWSPLPLLSQVPVCSSSGMLTRWCCSQQLVCVALPTLCPFPFWPHFPHLLQHKFLEVRHGFLWLSLLLVQWIAPITCLVNLRFAHFHCFIFLHRSYCGLNLYCLLTCVSFTDFLNVKITETFVSFVHCCEQNPE